MNILCNIYYYVNMKLPNVLLTIKKIFYLCLGNIYANNFIFHFEK